jgi:hypothetical protein
MIDSESTGGIIGAKEGDRTTNPEEVANLSQICTITLTMLKYKGWINKSLI